MKMFWFLAGSLAVALGTIGIFLPLLPTVPFLLLAAFCFAKSSKTAHDWLLNHKTLGPPIQDWNNSGAISKPAKIAATFCILGSFLITLLIGVPAYALGMQALVLGCVSLFIWTRPSV